MGFRFFAPLLYDARVWQQHVSNATPPVLIIVELSARGMSSTGETSEMYETESCSHRRGYRSYSSFSFGILLRPRNAADAGLADKAFTRRLFVKPLCSSVKWEFSFQ